MVIYWEDVDQIETPGSATVGGLSFEVDQIHIDAWKDDPDGVWTLTKVETRDSPTKWLLASFHPSEDRW